MCLNTYWNYSRQHTLALLGPMLQSPASLAVDHSFICITNWGTTWVYSPQNISYVGMCGEIRQWSWIFAWHHFSLLGSHILYDCICLLSNKIPAPSSLWKWSTALSTSLTGPGTFQRVSHTVFFCYLTSSHRLQLSGIQSYSKPYVKTWSTSHQKFWAFLLLSKFLVQPTISFPLEKRPCRMLTGSLKIAETASQATPISSGSWLFLLSHFPSLRWFLIWVPKYLECQARTGCDRLYFFL